MSSRKTRVCRRAMTASSPAKTAGSTAVPARSRSRSTAKFGRHLLLVGAGGGQGVEDLGAPRIRAPSGMSSPAAGRDSPCRPTARGGCARTRSRRAGAPAAPGSGRRSITCSLTCSYSSVGERALLVQHLLADADLADVVQPAGGADRPRSPRRTARSSAATMAERSATRAEWPREIGVLGLEGVDQRLEGGHRDPLRASRVRGAPRPRGRHLLLEPLVDLRGFHLGVPRRRRARSMARPRSTRSIGLTR